MKRRKLIYLFAMISAAVLLVVGLVMVFTKSKAVELSDPSLYIKYIDAYSPDVISRHNKVYVHITDELAELLGEEQPEKLFKFSPSVKGKTVWETDKIVSFEPDLAFNAGTKYLVEFRLDKIDKNISKNLRTFKFSIHTKFQDFDIVFDKVITTDLQKFTRQDIEGTIRFLDYEPIETVQKLMSAEIRGQNQEIEFEDLSDNSYKFKIKNIERTEKSSELIINYDGKTLNIPKSGNIKYPVPSLDDFVVIDVKTEHFPEQHAVIVFSDPVREDQLLKGLINIRDSKNPKYIITDNTIKVIPEQRLERTHKLTVYKAVQNIHGKRLNEDFSSDLNFRMLNPELQTTGEGVILPTNTHGLVVPFKAVNLRAVDVRIIKIYNNNILQFLQDNDLAGSSSINKVGKVIKAQTINLQTDDISDLNKWNTYNLDITELITPDPGAIYRIEIGFRKENAIYPCEEDKESITNQNSLRYIEMPLNLSDWFTNYTYTSYNDDYDDYYYYYDYDYDSYDNPCKDNYYGYRRAIKMNVLATDIGIIAKKGKDEKIHVFTSDISKGTILKSVKIEVYNFQQQVIASAVTDSRGKVEISIPKNEEASFIIASNQNNNQKTYLKLNSYLSLSTSGFDVSGDFSTTGDKSFIYTERGVYRPGDSIFLSFIYRDAVNEIPVGHPVVLEVYNPRGQNIYREVQSMNDKAFHVFSFKTDIEDLTGNYHAKISLGSNSFSKYIMVETIKPNRLNIDLSLDKEYLTGDGSVNAKISVNWLHGAVGKNLDTEVTMTLYRNNRVFKGYEDYNFYNNYTSFDFTTSSLLSGKTDDNGIIKTQVSFRDLKNAPGVLTAYLTTKVFEKGGNFSITENSFDYYPYKNFVGLNMPDKKEYSYSFPTNKDLKLDIVLLDREGKPVKERIELELSIYKIEYSWWYDYGDSQADFISANYNNAIRRNTIQCNNGRVSEYVDFETDGDYLVAVKDKKNGHTSSLRVYVSRYASASGSEDFFRSAEILNFKSDKETYYVGEDIKIKVPAKNGLALVSIENSTSVLESYWKTIGDKEFEISIKATEEMAPNVFVSISFVQAHADVKNDRPLRMYGIIPILVENPKSKLEPVIGIGDELQAESKIKVKVSEKNGMPMTYTLAIVDEGLLSLTRFKTPDPWSYFYQKQSLGVSTWDLFKYVIGMHSIESGRRLTIGGDEAFDTDNLLQALRFKPMVIFIGPIELKSGKENVHEIQLPQYIGAVRTMVVAAEGNAYGSAEKKSLVKKPIMLLGSAPRVIGTEEEMSLPVNIFAMDKNVKNVTVSVKTNDLFTIIGDNSKTIKFDKEGDQFLEFKLIAKNLAGVGKIEISAVSGVHKANYSIEMNVRHPNPPETHILEILEKDGSYLLDFEPFGVSGTNNAFLEIYSIPPMNLEKRLNYLISYPHGCLEQIISAAFPQLYLENFVELSEQDKKDITNYINRTISLLVRFQVSSGGMSYWPGGMNTNDWGTTYAGHFMLEAEKTGYQIPSGLKHNWLAYQKNRASRWTDEGYYSQLAQAYRLYTLALAGSPDLGAMNRLKSLKTNIATQWRLALTYSISGNKKTAQEMILKLSTEIPSYREFAGNFGSATRDKAMILETLINLDEKEKAFLILREIAEYIGSDAYANTQTISYSLMSAAKYISKYGKSGEINCVFEINGQKINAKTNKPVFRQELKIIDNKLNNLVLTNNSKDLIYVRLVQKGIPEKGSETAVESNIKMDIRYSYLNGTSLNPADIVQGTDFIATVKLRNISNNYNLENTALTQIFPSGWEIINQRMFVSELGESSYYDYRDIRDDRVLTYTNLVRGNDYTYRVLLNAGFAGKFYLPSVSAETMYDGSNVARTRGQWVVVSKN